MMFQKSFVGTAVAAFAVAAVLAGTPSVGHATTIFYDGFEGYANSTEVNTISPVVGISWSDSAPENTYEVFNSGTTAYAGTGYMDIFRASGGQMFLSGNFTEQTGSDPVIAEFRFRLMTTGSVVALQAFLAKAPGGAGADRIGGILIDNNGNVSVTGTGSTLIGVTLPISTSGQWNHAVLEYVPGSTSISLSVNGSTPVSTAVAAGNPNNLTFSDTQVGLWNLIDEVTVTGVPEPASLALLSLGGVLMLRRRGGA